MYKTGTNFEDMQEMNRALVIRLLRFKKIWSRTEIAQKTGLKKATITNIINDFLKLGLVKETGPLYGKKHRRIIGISLNDENYAVIGMRLSRNFFSVGLFDIAGIKYDYILDKIDPLLGPEIALEKIKATIKNLLKSSSLKKQVVGMGMAIPGPYFSHKGRIALMTEFPGWGEIAFEEEFKSEFDIPIYFEHDANAAAVSEWWYGEDNREIGTLIYIFITEGVGAGIIIDGNVYKGKLGTAGEIGHMTVNIKGPECECGNRGCLENYCSTVALIKETKEKLTKYPKSILHKDCSIEKLFLAFNKGDELAREVIINSAEYLGYGIVNIINSFNPDTVVIGGEIINAGAEFLDILKNNIKQHTLPEIYANTKIKFSFIKEDAVVLGSSAIATEKFFHSLINTKNSRS